MSDSIQPVTMSMIWTFLLFTVRQHVETSPVVGRAWERAHEGRDDTDGQVAAGTEEILEELAREQFPGGMINGYGWQYYANGAPHPFWDVFRSPYEDEGEDDPDPETFCEVCEILHEPLSPTDPAHVAMVARALALSFSMPCGVEPVTVEVDARLRNDPETDETIEGVVVQVRDSLRSGQRKWRPVSAGRFFPGESIEDAELGTLLFRWFLERNAEIAAALSPPRQATT